jgi:class 3 adenylate cyclase
MVFFNDPEFQEDHAARAVRLAVAIRERFAEISEEWRPARPRAPGRGWASRPGYATMGRIGFEGRYDYGGIGNAIILAARLSSEAKAGEILIAQRTFGALGRRGRGGAGRRPAAEGLQPADARSTASGRRAVARARRASGRPVPAAEAS